MTWQLERSMTPEQLEWYLKKLEMSYMGFGRYVGCSERKVRRMIRGEVAVDVAYALLLRSLVYHKEKPMVPEWVGIRARRAAALSTSTG